MNPGQIEPAWTVALIHRRATVRWKDSENYLLKRLPFPHSPQRTNIMPLLRESNRGLDVLPSCSVERVEELHKIVLVLVCQLERDNEIVLAGGLVS